MPTTTGATASIIRVLGSNSSAREINCFCPGGETIVPSTKSGLGRYTGVASSIGLDGGVSENLDLPNDTGNLTLYKISCEWFFWLARNADENPCTVSVHLCFRRLFSGCSAIFGSLCSATGFAGLIRYYPDRDDECPRGNSFRPRHEFIPPFRALTGFWMILAATAIIVYGNYRRSLIIGVALFMFLGNRLLLSGHRTDGDKNESKTKQQFQHNAGNCTERFRIHPEHIECRNPRMSQTRR